MMPSEILQEITERQSQVLTGPFTMNEADERSSQHRRLFDILMTLDVKGMMRLQIRGVHPL